MVCVHNYDDGEIQRRCDDGFREMVLIKGGNVAKKTLAGLKIIIYGLI